MPASLTVDCASRRNYAEFRRYPDRIWLAGLVTLTGFKGTYGRYNAGTLFLFPVLKTPRKPAAPAGAQTPPAISAFIPVTSLTSVTRAPLPAGHNAESLRGVLGPAGAAVPQFLGFRVDVPVDRWRAKQPRFTNGRLPDGTSVGIEWTVSTLNRPWFGGPTIPHTDQCQGRKWRAVIVEGLKEATRLKC